MINPDWARWIFASVAKYFKTIAATNAIALYVEGDDQKTANLEEYFELRIVGPFVTELSKDTFQIDININLLVTVAKSKSDKFRIHTIGGLLQSSVGDIPIMKLGSHIGDDGSVIFCLTRSNVPVKWIFMGRIEGLLQGVVDSKYRITVP